jgi:hypothetical protein
MATDIVQTSLARYDNDGLELIVDQSNGTVFASQSALARMCGVRLKTIREWRNKGVSQINVISAQVQTAGGMQGVSLFDEDAIFEAFNEYNPSLLIQCAKIGLRMYLHGLAGYRYEIKQGIPAKPKSLLDLSPTKLYQLAAHQLSVECGKKPSPELVEGIDREYLSATSDAAFCAYHKSSYEIAKGTKLANDALREVGYLEYNDKDQNLDAQFAGARDFYRFESRQLTLAGDK